MVERGVCPSCTYVAVLDEQRSERSQDEGLAVVTPPVTWRVMLSSQSGQRRSLRWRRTQRYGHPAKMVLFPFLPPADTTRLLHPSIKDHNLYTGASEVVLLQQHSSAENVLCVSAAIRSVLGPSLQVYFGVCDGILNRGQDHSCFCPAREKGAHISYRER